MARIILAEDDELAGNIVVELLMQAGHAVGWLRDGEQALQAMKFRPPQLVILDQHMPVKSGGIVLREMRMLPQLAMVPVLMLTAVCGEGDKKILYYEGADDYVTKPFDPDDLLFRAEALIDLKLRRTMARISQT